MSIQRHLINTLICIALLVFASTLGSLAQSAEPASPLPPPSRFDMKEYQALLQDQLADFNIAYVVGDEDERHLQNNGLGADFLTETFGISRFERFTEVESWAGVNLNALIVTSAALTAAAQEELSWIADTYRRGTIIAFVNVPFETQMEVLNITCQSNRAIQLKDYPVD